VIYSPLYGESINPVMGVSYRRKAVSHWTRTSHCLLYVRTSQLEYGVAQTRVWSETQGFSDPRLKWSAELFRPALEIWWGLLRLAFEMRCRVSQTRVERWFTQVPILVETRPSRWSEARSEGLSLVIFRQPTNTFSNILKKNVNLIRVD